MLEVISTIAIMKMRNMYFFDLNM